MTEFGDCFEVAGNLQARHPDWVLCHGIAVLSGGPLRGRRFWHAWCEYDEEIELPPPEQRPEHMRELRNPKLTMVVDHSNGHDFEGPAVIFYGIGQVSQVWRYDRTEAATEMLRHEHWGPWVEAEDVL